MQIIPTPKKSSPVLINNKSISRSLSPFTVSKSNRNTHYLTDSFNRARFKTVNKYIKDLTIDPPRPASYYIDRARDKYLSTSKPSTPVQTCHFSISPKRKSGKDERPGTCSPFLPDWLNERADFKNMVRQLNDSGRSPSEITSLTTLKSDYDKELLFDWLSTVRFFCKLSSQIIRETCEKLSVLSLEAGETIIKKGDQADCMYIVYNGKANIFLEGNLLHAEVGPKDVIGEHALDTQRHRSATVISSEAITLLKLTKLDYDSIILNYKKCEKQKNCSLLSSIPYFKNWTPLKIQHFSNFLIKKTFLEKTVIFDKGDEPNTFFIIKSGQVAIQAHVGFQVNHRWPTGVKSWKISEVSRKYLKTVSVLGRAQYFGEVDLINRDPRKFRAVSEGKVVCLTIDKDEFFDVFSAKDIENLAKFTLVNLPCDEELEKMLEMEIREKEMNVRVR
jgi:CRP-like cAMP-binding protein